MNCKQLILEEKDFWYLKSVLKIADLNNCTERKVLFEKLSIKLDRAKVVTENEMPRHIVRFSSEVILQNDTKNSVTIQINKPSYDDLKSNEISNLSRLSITLLGYAMGDIITWQSPIGEMRLKIARVEYIQTEEYYHLRA
jgi:regulator of nucleoside diphosphate kinase